MSMAEVEEGGRERWTSRVTFILGAIGSAVGLGNLWRFPYLSYRFGGGTFLIPYAFVFFLIGLPLSFLELTLGRHFQGGDPVCFSAMHPRMVGIGWMSAFASFVLSTYYSVIIAWVLIYFAESFMDPLPWAGGADAATSHFYGDILRLPSTFNEANNLTEYAGFDPGAQLSVNLWIPVGLVITYVAIYASIYKGVGAVSQVVKFSVPVPLIMLVVLFGNSVGREGASLGVEAYVGTFDLDALNDAAIWQEATSQIFFSIGVCFGIMTAYSSYREERKGVLGDAFWISTSNSLISVFAGFVVFTAIGVMANDLGFDDPKTWGDNLSISGPGLVFVGYPYALALMGDVPQVFSVIFFSAIFLLAIDSAFSIVEAVTTAMHDTNMGQKYEKKNITAFVCVSSMACAMFITCDNGLYMFDIVDHYMNNYIMLGVGALECFACMWVYGHIDTGVKCGSKSATYMMTGFFVATFGLALLFTCIPVEEGEFINVWASLGFYLVATAISLLAGISVNQSGSSYDVIFGGGADKFIEMMTRSEFGTPEEIADAMTRPFGKFFYFFIHMWAIMVKYLIPSALVFMMSTGAANNFKNPYGGYQQGFQNIGNFVVMVAYGIFATFVFLGVDMYTNRKVIETEIGFQVSYMQDEGVAASVGKYSVGEVVPHSLTSEVMKDESAQMEEGAFGTLDNAKMSI